jgi:acetoin utilization deacetylase AcuC-like enzyme
MHSVGYLYDPLFLEHDHPGHPESADRLRAVIKLLREKEILETLTAIPFTAATIEELTAIHTPLYVSQVYALSSRGRGALNPDTYLNSASYDAAALAVGACVAATNAVLKGEVKRAFALVRPPGHHAFVDHGEGFCIFNNVAFAAKRALGDLEDDGDLGWSPSARRSHKQSQPQRAMIVDFDVHHGNGTQAIFYDDPRVLYASLHQYGWMYPGSGSTDERGRGAGKGMTLNIPLPAGVGDKGYARIFDEIIAPAARRFKPHLLLVSAGYDAHWRDPLAHMSVSLRGFAHMMRVLCELSEELCDGRLVAVLEGGYDFEALSYGVLNSLRIVQSGAMAKIEDPIGLSMEEETRVDELIDALELLNRT